VPTRKTGIRYARIGKKIIACRILMGKPLVNTNLKVWEGDAR
jgi:hypothetical protein